VTVLPPGSLLAAALIAAPIAVLPAAGQDGRPWYPEDRFIITDFAELGAVAADMRRVYAAAPYGIQVYDAVAERWEAPVTAESGFPAGRRPTALAFDPMREALWLGTANGELHLYALHFGRWERHGTVPGEVQRIVAGADPRDGAVFILTRAGWYQTDGFGLPAPAAPASVPAVAREQAQSPEERISREDPGFRAIAATVAVDGRHRRWSIADAAPGQRPGSWWLATRGAHLFHYDAWRGSASSLPFGTASRGVSALALDGDAIWYGGDGLGPRRGVTRGGLDLQQWRSWLDEDGAPRGEVRSILPLRDAVWFAASDGVYRLDRRTWRWRRVTEGDGLAALEASALAPGGAGGLWVGTRRGIARLSPAGTVEATHPLGARRVNALHAQGDTLWIGTDAGLMALPGDGVPVRTAVTGRVMGIATDAAGTLWAATEDALYRRDAGDWAGPLREAGLGGAGRITTLVAAHDVLWVGGSAGIAALDMAGVWTYYRVGADLPAGPVRALVATDGELWAGTPAGAVRLRWRR
jgi:ligand-binding sensor domain-containing protein